MKIAIYARVSTDKQELDQQIEACKRFCEYKQFEIKEIYTDIGSGKNFFQRPNFMRLQEELKSRKYNGLVVFRIDRIGRNTAECILFFQDMERLGVQVFSINEGLDNTTAIGRAMRNLILVLAELERENISEATKERLQAVREAGKKLGRPSISTFKTNRIINLKKEGKSIRKIAKELDLSVGVVHKTLAAASE